MHKDCIILALEKDNQGQVLCLKDIMNKSFLAHVAAQLKRFHICKVVFAVEKGYSAVQDYIYSHREEFDFAFDFSETEIIAGTGGAVMHALQYSDTTDVLIVDGKKYLDVSLDDLIATQETKVGDVSIALKYLIDTKDYEQFHLNENNQIISISESNHKKDGLIDGGVYCIFRPSFLNINFPKNFSFQEDFIKKQMTQRDIFGLISEGEFYNISQAEDIQEAIKNWTLKDKTNATSN